MSNKYREELEKELSKQECPHCECKDIGIDNWGMFPGKGDWFYFCKECDATFSGYHNEAEEENVKVALKGIFDGTTTEKIN